jgi:hypothetical protein
MSALSIVIQLLKTELPSPVYPLVVPQTAALPFVVVSVIHEAQDIVLEGANPAFVARLSIACHGADAAGMDAVGEQVKGILETVVNRTLIDTSGQPTAGATFWKEGSDISDFSEDRSVFRRIMDWRMRWWRIA